MGKMKTDCFIAMVAPKLTLMAYKNGYRLVSPVIAQAILESGWGDSKLSEVYNYFGMKTNDRWNGEYVSKETWEENPDGTTYKCTAKFRKYNSLNDGLQGYYDFISISRYDKVRKANSYSEFCIALHDCGYATDSKYPDKLIRIIKEYHLDCYDNFLNYLKGNR